MSVDEAHAITQKAEKTVKTFSLFGGTSKYEKARTLFNTAANLYKAAGNWSDAAESYTRAYDMAAKLNEEHSIVEDLRNAARMYHLSSDPRALRYLEKASELLLARGRNGPAAKLCTTAGETCELQSDTTGAVDWYQRSSKLWHREGSARTADEISLRASRLLALSGEYRQALEIYEKVGKTYAKDRVLRGCARRELLLAGLCHLALIRPLNKEEGVSSFYETLRYYERLDSFFTQQSWEHRILSQIAQAFQEESLELFDMSIQNYKEVHPLDEVRTKLLLHIRNVLELSGCEL